MTPFDVSMVVIVAAGMCVLAWLLSRLWFSRMVPSHRAALRTTTLRHYTTSTAGQAIDQGNGTVKLEPRRGLRGAVNELVHQNWAGIILSRRSVYFFAGVPTDFEKGFHCSADEMVVLVSGADLLAQHPGRLHCARRDTAIAVRGGYEGPGTVQTVPAGDLAAQ